MIKKVSTNRDVSDMKDYLITFDAKAKELAATINDPAVLAAEMLKSLPERQEGAGLMQWNVRKYLKK